MSETEIFAETFDTAARDFGRLGEFLWRPIGAATVDRTAPRVGDRVFDACCGDGASAIPAAHRVGPSGLVDAVDVSASLLRGLDVRAAGLPQLRTHRADVLAWPGSGYDVVQCVLGVFFLPDMTAGTERLIGRARDGGTVGVTIWRRGAVEAAGRHLGAALAAVTGVASDPRPEHLIDRVNEPDAFRDWLCGLGLDDVEVGAHDLRLAMTPEVAWLLVTGSGYVGALTGLTVGQIDDVRGEYLASLDRAGLRELDVTTLIGTGVRRG